MHPSKHFSEAKYAAWSTFKTIKKFFAINIIMKTSSFSIIISLTKEPKNDQDVHLNFPVKYFVMNSA